MLFLLCSHLNRLGYEAYVTNGGAPPYLTAPLAATSHIEAGRVRGREEIVIYPEIVAGNPLGSPNVVRYLLNRPGTRSTAQTNSYGRNDYFIHFAPEFVPEGWKSQGLMLPPVDARIFREPKVRNRGERSREGFLLYRHRHTPDVSRLPDWMAPSEMISMSRPHRPEELAILYRARRGLVIWERTAAAFEAIHCGCPVIAVATEGYDPSQLVERLAGNGVALGFDRDRFESAEATVGSAKESYRRLFDDLDRRIHAFAEGATRYFRQRGGAR